MKTRDQAYAKMLERAAGMASSGWRVSVATDDEIVVVKRYTRPREDRSFKMSLVDTSYGTDIKNVSSGRPSQCEFCGSSNTYADVTHPEDDAPVVACKDCFVFGNGLCGIVEWGWVDLCGPEGVPGIGAQQ